MKELDAEKFEPQFEFEEEGVAQCGL